MRKTNWQTARVRAHLAELSGEKKGKGNRWVYQHLVKNIVANDEQYRLAQIWDFWSSFTLPKKRTLSNFWHWYKNGGVTVKDIEMWRLYYECVCELCPHLAPKPTHFCQGVGEDLYKRLQQWCGECGNPMDSVVKDYFNACILNALDFNEGIILTGKSFFNAYGWSCFLEYINSQGGKNSYLLPCEKQLQQADKRGNKLQFIQSVRNQLLAEGSLDLYDEIGQMVSSQGVDRTYTEVYEWTK